MQLCKPSRITFRMARTVSGLSSKHDKHLSFRHLLRTPQVSDSVYCKYSPFLHKLGNVGFIDAHTFKHI